MTRDEILSMFERLQEAWIARDWQALTRAYAPDATVRSPMFGELRGREAIVDSCQSLFRTFGRAGRPRIVGGQLQLESDVGLLAS
jgi:ketosteroid isomerase-like protein